MSGPDLVPKELVAALLAARVAPGETVPEVVVGRPPANLPFEVPTPESARMVGGLAHRSGGTLVFAVPQRPVDAVRAYEGLLQRTGWRVPMNMPGGFRRAEDVVYAGTFCQGERRSLSVSAADRPEGGTFLRVAYAAHERWSPCEDRRRAEPRFSRGPIPTFYPPERTTVLEGGSVGGGRDYMEAQTRLKTELGLPQLVAHYGAQAGAQGWSLRSESTGPELSAQTWRIVDREGRTWVGLLMAHSIPGSDERVVVFRTIPQTIQER